MGPGQGNGAVRSPVGATQRYIMTSLSPAIPHLGSHREDHGPTAAECGSYTKAGHHEEGEAAEDSNPGTSEDIVLA